jgi:hypothetical protein
MIHMADNQMLDASAGRTIVEFFQALPDQRKMDKWIADRATMIVPNILKQTGPVIDPYARETKGIIDNIRNTIPVWREGLPVKIDVWGRPMPAVERLGPDLLSPIIVSQIANDPVEKATRNAGIFPAKLPDKIQGVQLTPEDAQIYRQMAGQAAYALTYRIVSNPSFEKLPVLMQQEIIKSTVESGRSLGRQKFLMERPELLRKVIVQQITAPVVEPMFEE